MALRARRVGVAGALVVAAFAAPLLAFWADVAWIHPARNYYTVDTEFQYFLNSLAPFKGEPYYYVDHPGTPLEVLGTLLLALSYPVLAGARGGFIEFHLNNPGVFLDAARTFLTLAHVACMVALYRFARRGGRWDDILEAAAIASMYFAIHPYSLGASAIWNHNSFSFPFGALLLVLFARALSRAGTDKLVPAHVLVLLGLGAGALASVTIYLAAWLIGMLVSLVVFYRLRLQSWSRTALAAIIMSASGIAGFGLAVLPVAARLPVFRNWIVSLLTYQSQYLAVSPDEPRFFRIMSNLGAMYDLLPVLLVTSAILLSALALGLWARRRRLQSEPAAWSLLIGLAVQSVALLLVFLDRPIREAYLLSVAAIFPVFTTGLLQAAVPTPLFLRAARVGLAALVLAGLAANSFTSMAEKRQETRMLDETQAVTKAAILKHARSVGRDPEDLTIVWMYGSYALCWGLRTGDAMTNDAFAADIDHICPNQYRMGLNLRYDVHGDAITIQDGAWDMIFTCNQYVLRLVDAYPGASVERVPSIQWSCGGMNIFRRE